jgi:hypothetical protein
MTSKLEAKFELLWRASNGPKLEREYHFCPMRKWRTDYFHRESGTLIEIEGGMWMGGRHQKGHGFSADAIKYNVATFLKYKLYRLPSSLLTIDYVADLVRICNGQTPTDSFVLRKR